MQVTMDTGRGSARDVFVPTFQLCVLLAIKRAPEQQATVRDITDIAADMYRMRLDTAQTHIALDRLKVRGLTEIVTPAKKRRDEPEARKAPTRHKLTALGGVVAEETVALYARMIAFATPVSEATNSKADRDEAARRHEAGGQSKLFPSRALRK
jgi:hypothetical protein